LLVWLLLVGDADAAVTRTISVLVISCPHALGLAIPLVIALATSLAARQGILVRDRPSLERMRDVDTVLFDKTGTLTRGERGDRCRRAGRRRRSPTRAGGRNRAGV
jgi:P-type Cu2+ transporter